jgi:membrane fusion protein (multidrug efflux system)
MSKKKWIWTIVIITIVVVLALPKIFEAPKQAKKSGMSNQPVFVSVYQATFETLKKSTYSSGNILADEEAILIPEIQGRIVAILFEEGKSVKKGQLLVKLNDAELQAQLKRAVVSKKLKLETEKRNKILLQKGALSQEVYDQSLTDLQMNDAEIELLNEQIRKTEIKAPFDGIIGLRNVSVGDVVNSSSSIATIQKIDQVKLEFPVSEKYANQIKLGTKIRFSLDAQTDTITAIIYAIEPRIDEVTRNVMVRARSDNKNGKLIPGSFVRIVLPLSENKSTLMIPTQSVVPILKGQKVFVVVGDSIIEKKIITGVRNDTKVEVISGFEENDKIVVKGVIYMRQGAKVKIENQ